MNYAVVTVGYNRKNALKRLLDSICIADFCDKNVDLIVSLDCSDKQNELVQIAEAISWTNGEKIIRAFPQKQGLRKHILQCGDLTEKYDAVIVLEDDLVVSKGFFKYVVEAIEFYDSDENICGISLYNHRTNPGCGRPFEAANNGYDNYFMKYAQSWGQCWTARMWKEFKDWYAKNEEYDFDSNKIPNYVKNWNKQSWLKYYIAYCAIFDKYYVYPQVSLTTNNTEVGEHNTICDPSYQVQLLEGELKRKYCFSHLNDGIKYDAFFERIFDEKEIVPELEGRKCVDLYGLKKDYGDTKYVITTNSLPYRIVKCYSLNYRPHEKNLIMRENGNDIKVYDITIADNKVKEDNYNIIKYDIKAISSKSTLLHGLRGVINRIKRR